MHLWQASGLEDSAMINHMDYQRLCGPYHLLHPLGSNSFRQKRNYAKPGHYKDQDFPEYIVDVTRNTLVTISDSVNQASMQSYLFFSQVCQYYAFERISRQFAAFGMMPSCGVGSFANNGYWALPALGQVKMQPAAFSIDHTKKAASIRPATTAVKAGTVTPSSRPTEETLAAACAIFTAMASAFMAIAPTATQAGNLPA